MFFHLHRGIFLTFERPRGFLHPLSRFSASGGRVRPERARAGTCACEQVYPRLHWRMYEGFGSLYASFCAGFAAQLLLFLHRFLPMMVFAEGLQIIFVREQSPIATMRLDMVDHSRIGTPPQFGTFPAERFLLQLLWSQLPCPNRKEIPAVVFRAHSASRRWSMPGTPAITG